MIVRATPAEWRIQEGFADLLDRMGVYQASDECLAWMPHRLRESAQTGRSATATGAQGGECHADG